MIVAHASDTHHRPSIIRGVADLDCDVIVLTGDILGNKGRVMDGWGYNGRPRIRPHLERRYQRWWSRRNIKKWVADFRGRPVIHVPGNHDFHGIEEWFHHYGHKAVWTLGEDRPFVDLLGKRWAGFREIPRISGEWVGETDDFREVIERTFSCQPDILVTHAPAGGVLDGPHKYGIPALTSALTYRPHKITHHFFGHEHSCGGQVAVINGVTHINGACHLRLHTI